MGEKRKVLKNEERRRMDRRPQSEKQEIRPPPEPYKGSMTGPEFGIAACSQIVGQDHTKSRGLPLIFRTFV